MSSTDTNLITLNIEKISSMPLPQKYESFNDMYRKIILYNNKAIDKDKERVSCFRSSSIKKHIIKLLQRELTFDENNIEIIDLMPSISVDDNGINIKLKYIDCYRDIIANEINTRYLNGEYSFSMGNHMILSDLILEPAYSTFINLTKKMPNQISREEWMGLNNRDSYVRYILTNVLQPHLTQTTENQIEKLNFQNVTIEKSPIIKVETGIYKELPQPLKDIYNAEYEEIKCILEFEAEYEEEKYFEIFRKQKRYYPDYRRIAPLTNDKMVKLGHIKPDDIIFKSWVFKINKEFKPLPVINLKQSIECLKSMFSEKFKNKTVLNAIKEFMDSGEYESLDNELYSIEHSNYREPDELPNLYASKELVNYLIRNEDLKKAICYNKKNEKYFDIRYIGAYGYDIEKIAEYVFGN